jgi:formylglycine-generating enzyme required for sulfatase activity
MRFIPEGKFIMGMNSDKDLTECQRIRSNCETISFEDEGPAHEVYLDAFYIDKYEVTNALYAACVKAGACRFPKASNSYTHPSYYGNPQFDNYPVIYVDWYKAKAYCEWRGAQLPTEAQWEKAARGDDGRIFPWGNDFNDSFVNFCDKNCTYGQADPNSDDGSTENAPVDAYAEGISPYGVYNMSGNVWEWLADWYSETYYQDSPASNPVGPELGERRVLRGGSWFNDNYGVRITVRGKNPPVNTLNRFGIRCAKSVP